MSGFFSTNLLDLDGQTLEEYFDETDIINNGDYIIESFMNGNWKDGVDNIIEINESPSSFADFVDDMENEFESDFSLFLDRRAFVNITNLYNERIR